MTNREVIYLPREQRQARQAKFYSEIAAALDHDRFKGGDLAIATSRYELRQELGELQVFAEKYRCQNSEVPAGGFSGANSGTMTMSRSGRPLWVEFNNWHYVSSYQGQSPFAVQVRVGGGLDYDAQHALLKASKEVLAKYSFDTDHGKSHISNSDGTNWGSVMLCPATGYANGRTSALFPQW